MKMETEDNLLNSNNDRFVICPLCHGSGKLTEKISLPIITDNTQSLVNTSIRHCGTVKFKSTNTIKLPLIKSPINEIFRKSDEKEKVEKQLRKNNKKYLLKPLSAQSGGDYSTEKSDYVDLLPAPTNLRNPVEAVKYALMQINNDNWEHSMQGLGTIIQVSRNHPFLIEPHMTKVNQTLCDLLHSMRSQATRFACQAAKELFHTMQSTTRPEFDEIVQCLLQRTADMNRFIRHDANEALDVMVTYIPPINSVRAIVDKGPTHKNALVRTTVARLLLCIVSMIQVHYLLTLPLFKETRKRIFDAAAILINDPNTTARNITKKLFELLLKDENFDNLFYAEVNRKQLKRIEKALIALKYSKQCRTTIPHTGY